MIINFVFVAVIKSKKITYDFMLDCEIRTSGIFKGCEYRTLKS